MLQWKSEWLHWAEEWPHIVSKPVSFPSSPREEERHSPAENSDTHPEH